MAVEPAVSLRAVVAVEPVELLAVEVTAGAVWEEVARVSVAAEVGVLVEEPAIWSGVFAVARPQNR